MIYKKKKYTKKILKYGGTNNKKNEENNIKVNNKEIENFPETDFSHGFFIFDGDLGYTPRTKKEYVKQSIIIKKKKAKEKKTLKEKISSLKGLTPVKKMTKGLGSAISQGMKEGVANYKKFYQNMKRVGETVTLKGEFGSMFKSKVSSAFKGRADLKKSYLDATRKISPKYDKDGKKKTDRNKNKNKSIDMSSRIRKLPVNIQKSLGNIQSFKSDVFINKEELITEIKKFSEDTLIKDKIDNLIKTYENNVKVFISNYQELYKEAQDDLDKEKSEEVQTLDTEIEQIKQQKKHKNTIYHFNKKGYKYCLLDLVSIKLLIRVYEDKTKRRQNVESSDMQNIEYDVNSGYIKKITKLNKLNFEIEIQDDSLKEVKKKLEYISAPSKGMLQRRFKRYITDEKEFKNAKKFFTDKETVRYFIDNLKIINNIEKTKMRLVKQESYANKIYASKTATSSSVSALIYYLEQLFLSYD